MLFMYEKHIFSANCLQFFSLINEIKCVECFSTVWDKDHRESSKVHQSQC